MNTRLRTLWDSLRKTYWFLPLVMMLLAVLLWRGTDAVDAALSARDKKAIAWLYVSDADAMRNLLLTIAVAIIGVVGVVFSIIMVPLSIAASQFGPRLLRTFLRDLGTQLTLGTFVATFIFCMAVLLQLSGKEQKTALPQISVNTALLLGLLSFGVLLFFINHVAVSMQAPVVAARVSDELQTAIRHDFPEPYRESGDVVVPAAAAMGSFGTIPAAASGYVQVRDDERLLRLATEHNMVMELLYEPGDFATCGMPLVKLYPAAGTRTLHRAVQAAFVLGVQRTLVQDVTFGINELVEMAVRALSPAIKDPFTAMTCLDWLGTALCQLCGRSFAVAGVYDAAGNLRVVRHPVTFTDLCGAAFHQIRGYGQSSRMVMERTMDVLLTVTACALTAEQRDALLYHAELVERGSATGLTEEQLP